MSLNILWILLLFSFILYIIKRRRASLIILIASLLWFATISFPFVPRILMQNLENKYQPLSDVKNLQGKKNIHIVVLGGGRGESRLIEGLRLYKILTESYLVFTGRSRAEKMKKTAMNLGVDESRIKLVPEARNTREEARDYLKQFGKESQVILVTDAAHMARAMYLFQSMGIEPVAAPTNHMIITRRIEEWGPGAGNIEIMDYWLHERVGLMWAKLGTKSVER